MKNIYFLSLFVQQKKNLSKNLWSEYINFLLFITYSSNFQFSSVYMLPTRHNFGQIDSTFENCDILKNLFQRNSLLSSNKRESLLTKFPLCSITVSTQLSESKSQS